MAGAHPTAGGLSRPTTPFINGAATFTAAVSCATGSWTQIVAANADRHLGVMVESLATGFGLFLNDTGTGATTNAFKLGVYAGATGAPQIMFFYGTGAVFGQGDGGTGTAIAYEI